MLSVITTNIFPIKANDLKFTINNLKGQTFQDFEWIFCDHYYEENRGIVKELCGNMRHTHFPACEMRHVGAQWHWELYNNALLMCNEKYFLRFGVYRYMHKGVLEYIVNSIKEKVYVDQVQRPVDESILTLQDVNYEERYDLILESDNITEYPITQCGMFSLEKRVMIETNGNNELIIRHHFEDCELNARWRNSKFPRNYCKMRNLKSSFLRIDHSKEQGYKPFGRNPCNREYCVATFAGLYDRTIRPHKQTLIFDYRGVKWYACPECYIMSPYNVDEYYVHLEHSNHTIAPIGVLGKIGRDIRILDEDMKSLQSFESKVDLLTKSHDDIRYLTDSI